MPYVAMREMRSEGRVLKPGDPVPEAEQWKRVGPWVDHGYIKEVVYVETGKAAQTAVAQNNAALVEALRAPEPEAAPDPTKYTGSFLDTPLESQPVAPTRTPRRRKGATGTRNAHN